jgi:antigen flippase
LWQQVFIAGAARFWSLLVTIGILGLSARLLGPHGRGLFAAAFAWATLGSVVLYLSLGQVALHEVTLEQRESGWHQQLLGTLIAFAAALTLLGWGIAAVLWTASDGTLFRPLSGELLVVGLLLLPLLIWEQYGSALLAMNGRVDIYNRAQMVGRGLALLVVVVLLALGLGVYGLLLGTLAGQIWVALRGFRFLAARVPGRPRASLSMARALAAGGIRLHLAAVGTIAITACDVLIVAHYRGASAAGVYQLGTQLLYVLMLVPQAATLVMYGRVAAAGPQAAWEAQRRIVAGVVGIVALMAVVTLFAAPAIVPVLAGDEFSESVHIFRIVLASAVGFGLSALMAPQWIGRGLFRTASAITLAVGAVNVVANMIVVPDFGLNGAALVLVGTSLFSLVSNGVMVLYCERGRSAEVPSETVLADRVSSP